MDGAEILQTVSDTFSKYLVLPPGASDAITLWVTHCHCFEEFEVTPRLNIKSPEKGCGKTTVKEVVALFVPRPLSSENLTVAVLFRVIEKRKPTILADEYDTWLRDHEELRGMLNAGHRRGGQALRCEGDNHEVRAFRVFAPAVLCGIGALPGTLHDRSIPIRLKRAKLGEIQKRFDSRHTDLEQELCRKLARWCADNRVRLQSCDPTLPKGAFNRLADNWRPLFAIAEIAGGAWPERAAAAFNKLTLREDLDAQSVGVTLLADIQPIFAGKWPPLPDDETAVPVERIFSRKLVELLCKMTDRPWSEAQRGKPISEGWLARKLAHFEIRPKTLRIGEDRLKGYTSQDFADVFDRYLCGAEQSTRDSVTYEEKAGFGAVTTAPVVTDQKPVPTEGMSRRHAQSDQADAENGLPEQEFQLIGEDALLI